MLRWTSRIFMVIGLFFLGHDAVDSAEKPEFCLTALGERWFNFTPELYQQIEPGITRHVSIDLYEVIVLPILLTPATLVFFAVWAFFALASFLTRPEY